MHMVLSTVYLLQVFVGSRRACIYICDHLTGLVLESFHYISSSLFNLIIRTARDSKGI